MVGPVISIAVLSFVGIAPSTPALAAILILGGLGGAAFHPPAAALAHRLGGDSPGLAMSVHITGGTLGFALGPLLFAPAAQHLGLGWTPLLAIPGLAVVAFFLTRVPEITVHHDADAGFAALRPYWRPLALLYAIVVLRTLASLSFATFVPIMVTRRGLSVTAAGAIAALYLFATGIGGFLGGPAADRFGPRSIIAWSLVLSAPFLITAPFLSGWLFIAALCVGGFFLQSTLPVNVIFGQALAPVSAATVSSLMMGFGWGMGGLSVPLVGAIADRYGIELALSGLACIPLLAATLTIWLPARAGRPDVCVVR
jgi:FSR family fosmidomycin resistance protein-like MFS transporter